MVGVADSIMDAVSAIRYKLDEHASMGVMASACIHQYYSLLAVSVYISILDNVWPSTFCSPLVLLTQNVKSSLDSSSARTQFLGGCRYLLHSLHQRMLTCFCIGAVISTCDRMQLTHILEGLLIMEVPHRQHNLQVGKRFQ